MPGWLSAWLFGQSVEQQQVQEQIGHTALAQRNASDSQCGVGYVFYICICPGMVLWRV